MRPTFEQRFWGRVEKTNNCWNWRGYTIWNGYGRCYFNGRHQLVHRVAYELLVAEIPEGLTIDHLCRNRLCVNPSHLEPVTMRENTLRGEGACARNARKTHCKHGHPLTPENVYEIPGRRVCKTCARERSAAQRAIAA